MRDPRFVLACVAYLALGILAHKGWTEHVRPVLVMMCNANFGGCQ